MKNCNFVQRHLTRCFYNIGSFIAIHPYYFVTVPVILSIVLSTGILFLQAERDIEFLITPRNARSLKERHAIETLFPMNTSSDFDLGRITRGNNGANLFFVAKDGGSILRPNVFDEIVKADIMVRNMTIEWDNKEWKYEQICAKDENGCVKNVILSLSSKLNDFHKGRFRFKYPIDINLKTFTATPYVLNLGGVVLEEENYVKDAVAFRLFYFYDTSNKNIEEMGQNWELNLRKKLDEWKFENVEVSRITLQSVEDEFGYHTTKTLYLIGIASTVVFLFSVITFMTTSWIRSKPLLGISAIISASMGIAASFGCMAYFNVKYNDAIIVLPFLMIGLGMDDSFVMLSAWRRTNPNAKVTKRMSEVYAEAATSITLTSLTDIVSFCFGIATSFPFVEYFCAYAAITVLLIYLYQITFFGGCMALSGYREAHQQNPINYRSFVPKEIPFTEVSSEIHEDTFLKFFRDKLGNALTVSWVKIIIIILFVSSLGIAIWGCANVDEGLDINDIFHADSESFHTLKLTQKHFPEFVSRVHVVFNTPLNYADPAVQAKIENITKKFEDSPYVAKGFMTESWLRFYIFMSEHPFGKLLLGAFDLSEKKDFMDGLHNVFLRFPQTKRFRFNIIFNENHTEILASRIFLTCINSNSKPAQRELFQHVRKVVDEADIPIIVHSIYFPGNEQIFAIRSALIQTICVTGAVVMITFFIFIPDIISSIFVMLTVLFIEVETIGYMSFWGVNVDFLSMISLVMCIGFSINYPAHTAYAYFASREKSSNEQLKSALYAMGMPIFQSSVSTILGIIILAFEPSYIFLLFLKTVFLIVGLTAVHALFLLPVVLSIINGFLKRNTSK